LLRASRACCCVCDKGCAVPSLGLYVHYRFVQLSRLSFVLYQYGYVGVVQRSLMTVDKIPVVK
jgi:hypothetical protein